MTLFPSLLRNQNLCVCVCVCVVVVVVVVVLGGGGSATHSKHGTELQQGHSVLKLHGHSPVRVIAPI